MDSVESLPKRKDLSVIEKISIIERYDRLPKMSQRNAAVQLQISQPLLCKLLKNRDVILQAAKKNKNLQCKRNRVGKDHEVESALRMWFTNVCEKDVRIDGPLMRQKAEELAKEMGKEEFVATEGWFHRWKKRENIAFKRKLGEQNDPDPAAADRWFEEEWSKIISNFSPDSVYNADETGLYFRALPQHTCLIKTENAESCRTSEEHLTVLCCANMSGDKERLLVIGKSKNLQCFKGVKNFPVDYYSNSNAWMTASIFQEWLLKWDNRLTRKIVLLIDNCAAHTINCELRNIGVVFLPANTTSILQPCDQGIIQTLKAYYRHEICARILESKEETQGTSANDLAKKINVLDAVHLLAMSWYKVSAHTIQNCFRIGFSREASQEEEIQCTRPPNMTESEFWEWMAVDENITTSAGQIENDIFKIITSTNIEVKAEVCEEEDYDNIVETSQPPTMAEMRQALQILRRGVQHRSIDFQKHYEYEIYINGILRENRK